MTYPRSLAGIYEVNFDHKVLTPVKMIDTRSSDYRLTKIVFKTDETAQAEFENGESISFLVKWDGVECSYAFRYNSYVHGFHTKTDLGETCRYVDVMSITEIDFSNL
ncbi:MAG TPA: hypothetical protein DGG95_12860 [Cytophagales bacterium]|jgi:hypothetical protein|nr:hypothetical protein [Cytophagales bacterium]